MVTRKEVAEYAGVSSATVSNVVNGKGIVSDRNTQKVLEAIRKLGYRPNMVARSLKTKESMQIALISDNITNPYFSEVALGMEAEARKTGYVVCLLNSWNDSCYMDEILGRQFDGIILLTDKMPVESINNFAKRNVPIVFAGNMDYKNMDSSITQVHIDTYKGARQLFEYLIKLGHKRIGFFSGSKFKDIYCGDYRMRAYMDVLLENSISVDPSLMCLSGETLDTAFDWTYDILQRKDRPTAIFAKNDNIALAVISAANKVKLKIPEDLSIAGFDNLSVGRYYLPALTTVDLPKYELGEKAMTLLLRKIRGESINDFVMLTKLVIRDSVSAASL